MNKRLDLFRIYLFILKFINYLLFIHLFLSIRGSLRNKLTKLSLQETGGGDNRLWGLNAGALSPTPPSFSRLASFLTKHEQKTRKKNRRLRRIKPFQ